MTIYTGTQSFNSGEFPATLAIGDSWFWYPKNNLVEALVRSKRLNNNYQHLIRLGKNGALLSEYVDIPDGRKGRYSDVLRHHLSRNFMTSSVILISGAGNDAIDYKLGLQPDCSNFSTVEACFNWSGAQKLLKQLSQAVYLLLTEIQFAYRREGKEIKVFLHTYDYPVPDGRGFSLLGDANSDGGWLQRAMNACLVPNNMELRTELCTKLIDVFADTLKTFDDPPNGIYHIDSRNTLRRDANYRKDWDNELHPTSHGFDQIVERCWVPVLAEHGICR